MGDIEFLSSGANEDPDEFRDESSNTEDSRVSEISLLESSTIMPSILVDEKNDRSKVAEQITEMRETLKQAILYLDINLKRNNEEDSLLDFAMLMALQSLELFFYRRAIGGIPPFSTSIERDLEDNDFDRIEQDRVVVNILDKLGHLLNA